MNTTSATTEQTALDTGLGLIKALCSKSAYHHDIMAVSVIETHISWVLLTGKFAYKIKKPVNFGFLDFSTLEKRRYFCHEELRLNRRFAANLYLDVVPITGSMHCPEMNGAGPAIEYAVRMLQFPSGMTLTELAESGKLGNDEIDQIAATVADIHEKAARAGADSPYGDGEDIRTWFDENFAHIRPRLHDEQLLMQLQVIQNWGFKEWQQHAELMQQRKLQGFVRECHGDLHLGNMTVIDNNVTLFDCIEFNPMLRWIDIISEVAFLVIDLLHFMLDSLSYRFLNRYLQASGDYSGLILLRYYLVYRALVRAKVSLLRLEQQQNAPAAIQQASLNYIEYANLAERFTVVSASLLIITHGFSGSGKSTLSGRLAEKIGAIQIRSDIERKRLFGFRISEQSGSGIDSGLYASDKGQITYQRLAELAKSVISAGFPVIIDAAFLKSEQRDLFRELADKQGARFVIIDFQAPDGILQQRILNRQREHGDASEATVDVLKHQLLTAEALAESELVHVLAINTERDNALLTLTEAFADYSHP